MSRRAPRHVVTLVAVVGALFAASRCPAQETGHKILGTLGLQAGVQPPTGFYVADQLVVYDSRQLVDQTWNACPRALPAHRGRKAPSAPLSAIALPRLATYVSGAVAVPVAWILRHRR